MKKVITSVLLASALTALGQNNNTNYYVVTAAVISTVENVVDIATSVNPVESGTISVVYENKTEKEVGKLNKKSITSRVIKNFTSVDQGFVEETISVTAWTLVDNKWTYKVFATLNTATGVQLYSLVKIKN